MVVGRDLKLVEHFSMVVEMTLYKLWTQQCCQTRHSASLEAMLKQ